MFLLKKRVQRLNTRHDDIVRTILRYIELNIKFSYNVLRKPYRYGVIARKYTDHTLTFITDGLRNMFYRGEGSDKYMPSNSMVIEWEVETNHIKKIEFAEKPTEMGENGTEITMAFKENYYQKYDIFRIDATKQQCIVLSRPVRRNDAYWEVQVRLIDNNFDSVLDDSGCEVGMTTTFQSVSIKWLWTHK